MRAFVVGSFIVFLFCPGSSRGQANPAPAPAALPQAPALTQIQPAGAARGSTVEVTFSGSRLENLISVVTSFPAKVSLSPDGQPKASLEIPPDIPLGAHTVRVATNQGISNTLIFYVDDLPQVAEVSGNDSLSSAQEIPVPGAVLGQVDGEKSDYFKFRVGAPGQRVTMEVVAQRVGSALDPIIFLYDVTTGREVPGIYADDSPGLNGDARLTYTFERPGEYAVRLRDVTHRGGAEYRYLLRVGDFPAPVAALPMEVPRGKESTVNFAGDMSGAEPVTLTAPAEEFRRSFPVAARYADGPPSWPIDVPLADTPQAVEAEPNDDPSHASAVSLPGGVTGRFLTKGDIDWYKITATKDRAVTVTARGVEVYLSARDGSGKTLATSKPEASPASVTFNPSADGEYFITAEHLNFSHGPNEVYHLSLEVPRPDFEVALGLDHVNVPTGGNSVLPVASVTRRGYGGPIELTIVGPDGVTGSVTVPAGQKNIDNIPTALIPVTVAPGVAPGAHPIRVRAAGKAGEQEIVRFAHTGSVPPASAAHLGEHIVVAVTDPAKFALKTDPESVEVTQGGSVKFKLLATRAEGFDEDITTQVVGLPPNVSAALNKIPKGQGEVEITLKANGNAPAGAFPLTFRGSTTIDKQEFAHYASPILVDIKPAKKK